MFLFPVFISQTQILLVNRKSFQMKLSPMLWEVLITLHQRFCASIMDTRQMYGVQELFFTFYSVVYHLSGLVILPEIHCPFFNFFFQLESCQDAVSTTLPKTSSGVSFLFFLFQKLRWEFSARYYEENWILILNHGPGFQALPRI